ncbi:ATP-dependent helicase [Georgenia alba]|uniref:DNA 3'-5' helicase n=1 Tax=Georgenia alba TaxID=2233858 RepID=A0ABW2QAX5_9MICO
MSRTSQQLELFGPEEVAARAPAPRYSAAQIADALGQHAPTPEQTRVIEAPLEPLLVVAGAGSGKTETMSARVVYLVANGLVRGEEVLGLTFTRKAAAELAHRVRLRLRALRAAGLTPPDPGGHTDDAAAALAGPDGLDVDRPQISTYNSFAGSLARDHALRVGADPDARLLTDAGAWQLADDVVQSWQEDLATEKAVSTVTQAVLELAGTLTENVLTPADARALLADLRSDIADKGGGRRTEPTADVKKILASLDERAALLDVVEAVERRKRERGLIGFADQVALAARVAAAAPEVGAQLRAQYKVVLLDEFQDTSVAQLELLANLFGDGHPVTAVGDPHQAIYGWRGASAASLAQFPERFPRRDGAGHVPAESLALSTSWRNDRAILDAANAVSVPLRAAPGPDRPGPAVEVPRLQARPGADAGEVVGLYAAGQLEEAARVADFVAERWSPAGERTAAVLCRKRSQFAGIVRALDERGLPHRVIGMGGLLATPEIVDVRAALRVAHDASRGDALVRLLTNLRLGVADLHVLQDWARHLAAAAVEQLATDADRRLDAREEASLVEAVEHPPPAGWTGPRGQAMSEAGAARVRRLGSVLRQVRALSHLALPELVVATEQLLGLDVEVAVRRAWTGAGTAGGRAALDAFADVAASFAADAERAGLGAFLDWLDAAEERERGLDAVETGEVEPDSAVVQVLTVHAAKGLEWDVVAVPGLVESQFPGYDSRVRPDGSVTASAWLTAVGELPYPLRRDSGALPALDVAGTTTHEEVEEARKAFRAAAGEHRVAEERRLAYVALTRARHSLLLSGSWFREGKSVLPPSRFLAEPRRAGLVEDLAPWAPEPADGAQNPGTDAPPAPWPFDPLGARRGAVEQAAAAVRAARGGGLPAAASDDVAARWRHDAALLLRERDQERRSADEVALDGHLSASAVVGLIHDPQAFARDRRRPVPVEPTVVSRRGTRFHAWVEHFYGRAALLDVEDVTGSGEDDVALDLSDEELARLQRVFTASEWASRRPVEVEVDLETPVAGTIVRCRIDAVFASDGAFEVVDWKTGRPPRTDEELAEKEMQLALYRLAWARAQDVPLERIGGAFYYVGHDVTVRAGDLDEDEIVARITGAIEAGGGRAG